ncbi:MAG: restriction endonuclease subunit S [Treponema sp.]|nr:restriction endonuclease subunit S [Treponema sp.]
MSKLDELIKELCPSVVEYRKLGEIADIKRGERITKTDLVEDGLFPVVSGGTAPMGLINKKNRYANTITISSYGAAGFVDFQKKDFWANDVCLSVFPQKTVVNKYLYYALKNQQTYIYANTTKAIPDHIPTKFLENLEIPVPPLQVQNEIVRILDKFTSLEAELEAELEARRKQYEYYRDSLLTFGDDAMPDGRQVEWKTLGEIAKSVSSGKNKKKDSFGDFIVYGSTGPIAKTDKYIYNKEQILIARVGANAGFVYKANGKYDVSDNTIIVDLLDTYNLQYIFYSLKNMNLHKYAKGGGQPLVTAGELKNIKIPLPPLEEQERIVAILDRFESLCNDITSGLPAEIDARRKQYEYYRDKLLTFKKKGA